MIFGRIICRRGGGFRRAVIWLCRIWPVPSLPPVELEPEAATPSATSENAVEILHGQVTSRLDAATLPDPIAAIVHALPACG